MLTAATRRRLQECGQAAVSARVRKVLKGLIASTVFIMTVAIVIPGATPVAAQTKLHQATGTVAASAPAQLAILKQFGRNKTRWTFVVNPKTTFDGKAAKGARVRILYHEEKGLRVADRVKILEASPESATAAASNTNAGPSKSAKVPKVASVAPPKTSPAASATQ